MGAGERETLPAAMQLTPSTAGLLDAGEGRRALGLLARLELVEELPGPAGRVVLGDGIEVSLGAPAAGAAADKASLERELKAATANIDRLEQQLASEAFVTRANPVVVQRSRDQVQAAREKRAALEEAISRAE
jgi:valyl-tRNA synthetase